MSEKATSRSRITWSIVLAFALAIALGSFLALASVDKGSADGWSDLKPDNQSLEILESLSTDRGIHYWRRRLARPVDKYLAFVRPEAFEEWKKSKPELHVEIEANFKASALNREISKTFHDGKDMPAFREGEEIFSSQFGVDGFNSQLIFGSKSGTFYLISQPSASFDND